MKIYRTLEFNRVCLADAKIFYTRSEAESVGSCDSTCTVSQCNGGYFQNADHSKIDEECSKSFIQ
jgi:hypothetical protein